MAMLGLCVNVDDDRGVVTLRGTRGSEYYRRDSSVVVLGFGDFSRHGSVESN